MSAKITRRIDNHSNGVIVGVRRGGRFVYAFVTHKGVSRSFRYAGGRFDKIGKKAGLEFFGKVKHAS